MNDENEKPSTAHLADGDAAAAHVDALIEQSSFGTDTVRSLRRRAEPAAVEKTLRLAQNLAVPAASQPDAPQAPSTAPTDE